LGGWPADADVLAIDLDVRERSTDETYRMIESTARQLCAAEPACRVLVKIDSTLRGPIASLVAGALEGSGTAIALVAPAFPEQGRFLHDGRLVVNGRSGPSLVDILGPAESVLISLAEPGQLERANL